MSTRFRGRKTPPSGVPSLIEEDERSVPVIVPDPAMSRPKTPTDPAHVTVQELARSTTLARKQMERDVEAITARVDEISGRVMELQEVRAAHEVHITTLRESLGEFESIAEFRETLMSRVTRLDGGGSNGEVGNLKVRLTTQDTRRWAMVMFCLGLITVAGSVVYWAGTNVATLRTEVDNLKSNITDLRDHPRRSGADARDAPPAPQEPLP